MELTRRDAIAAIAALGGGAGATAARLADQRRARLLDDDPGAAAGRTTDSAPLGEHERRTMIAIARVIYPTAVKGHGPFVRTYLDRRATDRPTLAAAIAQTVATLDAHGRDWHGAPVVDLERDVRERLLREVGADTADADPAGTPAERVRHHLIDELLFALYASPTGGRLVGLENPQGHPGGLDSYRRGPSR